MDKTQKIIDEAKQAVVFWKADNNYQVSIYTIEKLIGELEQHRKDYKVMTAGRDAYYQKCDSLTKERDEYKLGVSTTGDALVQRNLKLERDNQCSLKQNLIGVNEKLEAELRESKTKECHHD